ncbi:diphthamide biosynthesis enzyme Dph2 [Candidatus Bathyarchaeota archaeon]|nr:MAG: diphthamide biosynthesis enzyme Dph2 [Candidatus Bathyarchaeota archaeon]RJS82102.1 MAG: diphthamide biosynthesis enzyme Dph2 [Candidatus Bathyarchaeota archaeon]
MGIFMKNFDLEEERIKKEIQQLKAKRVLIQLPEGLKPEAPHIAKTVEKAGALPIISADPCYGACDLAEAEAESLNADLIIHYGHSKLLKYERVPTIYVEARATLKIDEAVEKALPLLEKMEKIGLATTVQHVQTLDEVREILTRSGKTVVIGDAGRLNYPGQVIGCDFSNAKSIAKDVEAFLFIGGGRFHALGVALSTSKPTVVADPYENRAYIIKDEIKKILKQRWASIEEAKKAKKFAVLVGLKPGQKRFEEALKIKEKLEKHGKTAFLFAVKEVTPEVLMEFPSIDAYVNTACPRLSLDDVARFKKPMLTINETLVVVNELSWEKLCQKGWFEN